MVFLTFKDKVHLHRGAMSPRMDKDLKTIFTCGIPEIIVRAYTKKKVGIKTLAMIADKYTRDQQLEINGFLNEFKHAPRKHLDLFLMKF